MCGNRTQTTGLKMIADQSVGMKVPSAPVEAVAGQRVQVIKPDKERGGILEFGTELVRASDISLVALLGASPGASTAAFIAM